MNGDIKKTAGQVLIESLTKVGMELSQITKLFEKFQTKQDGSDKELYEFKVEMINGIKDCDDKLKEFHNVIRDFINKMDIKDDKLLEMLNEVKLDIREQGKIDYEKIETMLNRAVSQSNFKVKLSPECQTCKISKEKSKWIKWLSVGFIISVLIILALLGLNLLGYIKLAPIKIGP